VLELLLCSMVTILPDYLYRRYRQGKQIGREITLYSVWFELRWGIVSCLILTVLLITLIFYYHPSTTSAVAFFRTVPILPEGSGRVAEIYVGMRDRVEAGQPIFRLDSTRQEAAAETARRRIAEVDAALNVAETDLVAADGNIRQAQGAYQQALDELETKTELRRRNPDTVAAREIERLQNVVDGREGALAAARAAKDAVERRISTLLPAERASAEAALAQAEVDLDKTTVYAGVDGVVEQFALRVGDIVNPLMRPAGILIPTEAGRRGLVAGFDQLEAQVIKPGMIGEVTCISKPFTVIPVVVTEVQDAIAAGQIRPGDGLIAQLVAGVGGVGNQLPEENLLLRIDGVHHNVQQAGDLGLEIELFARICGCVFNGFRRHEAASQFSHTGLSAARPMEIRREPLSAVSI